MKRAARTGVNPRTGEKIKIKASKAVKFKAGAGLKGAVKLLSFKELKRRRQPAGFFMKLN